MTHKREKETMLFDVINQGAIMIDVIVLSLLSFIFGFMISAIIFMDDTQ
jgi:hypothetical protein